ncbi:MAG TPA: LysM peptidoglycan-binding domain-containing protein [Flavitalea sp.]|nr:LysM peptidoglycan-binding domain-containing protein [Flavitalea sp.]
MIRKYCLFFLTSLIGLSSLAQSDLIVQGTSPSLYLFHSVAPKENWYSLGRMYNLSPKELVAFNNTSMDKPLEIGQVIKAPLTSANFSQNGLKAADEVFIPLYHVIEEREWLYRISVNHNKVPVEQLEKWNNIDKDQARPGMKLIVGYLKVKEANASWANTTVSRIPGSETAKAVLPKQEAPVKKTPEPATTGASSSTRGTASTTTGTAGPPETRRAEQQTGRTAPQSRPVSSSSGNSGGGYFRLQYEASGKTVSGVAGVFKSASGWEDGKYYALMKDVPVGSIIKINFPSTNKEVYAKVLGELPDMKESAGLTLRISDAAAGQLGASGSRFSVSVVY